MEYTKILKRAWKILWSYQILWIFGIILAFTTFSWPEVIFTPKDRRYDLGLTYERGQGWVWNPVDFDHEFAQFKQIPDEALDILVPVIVVSASIIILIILITPVFRYVSETALIRMVNAEEETGERYGFRKGFRLGWSGGAVRIFLLDLIVNIPFAVVVIGLLLAAAAPVFLSLEGSESGIIFGGFLSAGLVFLVVFIAIVGWAGLSLLKYIARQYCVLAELGVMEAIRQGYQLARGNLKAVCSMWLLMTGLELGWPILAIPLVFLGLVIGSVLGGGGGLLAGGLSSAIFDTPLPYLIGGLVGFPLFVLGIVIPVSIFDGFKKTFQSSTWTLTYRELLSQSTLQQNVEPV